MLKGVLKSRRGKVKAAYFQPLTQLEIVASHSEKRSLHHIREARVHYTYTTLPADMDKKAIALFLAEVLGMAIREEERNTPLYEFLEAAFQWLDTHENIANFHLYFMLQLSRYLGFYPEETNAHLPFFDLVEGEFVAHPTFHPSLANEELTHFKALLGTNFEAMHTIGLGKSHRQVLLQELLRYFELHLQGFKKPRSLAVLNEVFN